MTVPRFEMVGHILDSRFWDRKSRRPLSHPLLCFPPFPSIFLQPLNSFVALVKFVP